MGKRNRILSLFVVLLLIPLTIFSGILLFGNRKYYFTSLLVILEVMLPFFLSFENKKPKAREITIISVLCALGVAGRVALFMFPQFKPVIALIIITGLSFGSETGFLTGAIIAFVSNFYFGQGPWTPWQMFASGIIGYISGIISGVKIIREKRWVLSIFGFFATIILYGLFANLSSVFMWQESPSWEMLLSVYLAGLPMDILHGISTGVFLWFLWEPLSEKLERLKLKYGFFIR